MGQGSCFSSAPRRGRLLCAAAGRLLPLPDSSWNVQSALLQEVRSVLAPTYPNTTIQADRHVVLISFGSYAVEVAPVFLLTDGSYWICDTTGTGHYKVA